MTTEPGTTRPIALVTGGSRGIGAAIVQDLAHHGWLPLYTWREDEAAAQVVAATLAREGLPCAYTRCDVGDPASLEALFAWADTHGRLRLLVNNAGVTGRLSRVDAMSVATLDTVLAANVRALFLASGLAVARMSTARGGAGGSIINLSSGSARTGGTGDMVLYATTKGAVDTFTMGLAKELAGEGIRVNAVAPGLIDTEIHARAGKPERLQQLRGSIPLGRPGTALEVAQCVTWLASDAASYVTGSILAVAGGR